MYFLDPVVSFGYTGAVQLESTEDSVKRPVEIQRGKFISYLYPLPAFLLSFKPFVPLSSFFRNPFTSI
jgi:hypothetical protein